MNGWELYSWPSGNYWNHSLLPGTNRLKTYAEVTGNPFVVFGSDSLKMLLNLLPDGEGIFWTGKKWLNNTRGGGYEDLILPDRSMVDEIIALCLVKNLVLKVDK